MASTYKCNPQTFPFLTLTTALVFLIMNYIHFTMNYSRQLQNEFQSMTTYLRTLRNPEWFEVDKIVKMEHQQIKDATRARENVTKYYKTANNNPEWFDIITREMKHETFKMGLVNADSIVDKIHTDTADMVRIDFKPIADQVKWSDLAPERIDKNSTCPYIPMPRFEDYQDLDVVVASIPNCVDGGVRDVFRLQINLIVANLLVKTGTKTRSRSSPLLAVFLDSCGPMWEIFRCDDLLANEGNTSIYKPDLKRIKLITLLPVGACQFVPPFSSTGVEEEEELKLISATKSRNLSRPRREAYVTLLHTSEHYVCGAIVLAQSIIQSNSTRDLILLADENISPESIRGLKAAGWKIEFIERIRSPYSRKGTYNEYNYSKLRIWKLTQYEKLVFIDADFLVNRNMDQSFVYPQLTAAGNYEKHLFNSGLMFIEPSECTYKTLMEKMLVVQSYNGGDQGFLNEMFAWWHRLPPQLNYLKVFVDPKDRLRWIDDQVYAVHYTGLKPWKCYREKDCNWDEAVWNRYASTSAHRMWWKVYRAMPKDLRPYCVPLTPEEDRILEDNRWVEENNATSRVRTLRDKVRETKNSTSEHPTEDDKNS